MSHLWVVFKDLSEIYVTIKLIGQTSFSYIVVVR